MFIGGNTYDQVCAAHVGKAALRIETQRGFNHSELLGNGL
jgi:hypothetical protein